MAFVPTRRFIRSRLLSPPDRTPSAQARQCVGPDDGWLRPRVTSRDVNSAYIVRATSPLRSRRRSFPSVSGKEDTTVGVAGRLQDPTVAANLCPLQSAHIVTTITSQMHQTLKRFRPVPVEPVPPSEKPSSAGQSGAGIYSTNKTEYELCAVCFLSNLSEISFSR